MAKKNLSKVEEEKVVQMIANVMATLLLLVFMIAMYRLVAGVLKGDREGSVKFSSLVNIDKSKPKTLSELEQELESLTGPSARALQNTWETIKRNETARARAKKKGKTLNLKYPHLMITGNPGTGKTEGARLLARLMLAAGFIEGATVEGVNHKVAFGEVKGKQLIGMYIGESLVTTRKAIDTMEGGVLFIDEAYMLSESASKDDRAAEGPLDVIETLMNEMQSGRVIIFMAGYADKMESFYTINPGFIRRTSKLEFSNFALQDVSKLIERRLTQDGYEVNPIDITAILNTYNTWGRSRQLQSKLSQYNADMGVQIADTILIAYWSDNDSDNFQITESHIKAGVKEFMDGSREVFLFSAVDLG